MLEVVKGARGALATRAWASRAGDEPLLDDQFTLVTLTPEDSDANLGLAEGGVVATRAAAAAFRSDVCDVVVVVVPSLLTKGMLGDIEENAPGEVSSIPWNGQVREGTSLFRAWRPIKEAASRSTKAY